MWLHRTQMTFSSLYINLIAPPLLWWQEVQLNGYFYCLVHCGICLHNLHAPYYISFKRKRKSGNWEYIHINGIASVYCMLYPTSPFECKTAAQRTKVISMRAISILLRSLEQINTCSTFAESLMPSRLRSLRADTAVKEIKCPFKCRDNDAPTAVLFREEQALGWQD